MPSRYDNRKARRQSDQWSRLGWESLDAFHARENAKPPTLAEIYRSHPRVHCERTPDIFTGETEQERKAATQRSLWEQPRIIKETGK